jgi:hypothetical protein
VVDGHSGRVAMGSRRHFITAMLRAVAALGSIAVFPGRAAACLYGKWWLVCPKGDADLVDDGTCQHQCKTHRIQVFRGKLVTVRCPNGHDTEIDTSTCKRACTDFICPANGCGRNCRVG